MSENVSIDEDNHLHINIALKIADIFQMEEYPINIGESTFTLYVRELLLKPKQTIIIKGKGLATINTKNVFSVGNLSDVYIHDIRELVIFSVLLYMSHLTTHPNVPSSLVFTSS